jgi:polyisoprenoid-binding protein YceI/Flp pilus assembly protein TadD
MLIPLTVLALATAPAPTRLAIQEFAIDAGHSIVEFSVRFGLTRVKGRFPQTHGTILYDPAAPERSSVSIVIDATSIDTGWPHRDDHLRTDDFFDTERFPTIRFQSTSLTRAGDGWTMSGPLTMHGVVKQVAIPFRFVQPPSRRPESNWMVLDAVGALRLARREFGIVGGSRHNSWFNELRSATVADTVDVDLEIEGWLADAGSQRPTGVEDALARIRANGVSAQLDRMRAARGSKTDAEFAGYFHGGDLVVRALIADGRNAEAVDLSRGLVSLFPRLASASLVHGFALAVAGDARGAAQQYGRARKVYRPPVVDSTEKYRQDDDFWYFNDQLVRTALEWGRIHEAIGLARAVADIYPTTARAHVTLGLALALAGNAGAAQASYARALELDPRETRAIEWQRRLSP